MQKIWLFVRYCFGIALIMECTEICMDNRTWKAIYKRPPLLLGSIEMVLVHMKYNGFLEIMCVYIYNPFFVSLLLSHPQTHVECIWTIGLHVFFPPCWWTIIAYGIRIGFAEGVWMVGVIDEIRIPATETDRNPILVDTKTRVRDTLPAEPQRRNGRYVRWNFVNYCVRIKSWHLHVSWQASVNVLQVYMGQFSCWQFPLSKVFWFFYVKSLFYLIWRTQGKNCWLRVPGRRKDSLFLP